MKSSTYARNVVTLAASLGYMFDSYVINIYGITVTAIVVAFHINLTIIGLVGSVLVAGYMIGSFLFGMLGDRFGRRITLGAAILVYGGITAVSGFSQNVTQFAFGRFFTGLGGGGELTVGVPFIIESWGVGKRTRGVALVFGGYWAGLILAFLTAKILMGHFGLSWRSLYWFSIVPAVAILAIRFALEESPRYVATMAALRDTGRDRIGLLAAMRVSSIRERLLWGALIYISLTTIYYVQAFYQIAVMERTFKLDFLNALYVVQAFNISALIGTVFAGGIGDLVPRKMAGVAGLAVCGVAVWIMYSTSSLETYFAFGLVMWLCVGFSWVIGLIHVGELFPTEIRGAGFGWSVALGRIPSIFGPFLTVYIAQELNIPLEGVMRWSFTILLFGLFAFAFSPETFGTDIEDFVERRIDQHRVALADDAMRP